jgi:hypothetical protein
MHTLHMPKTSAEVHVVHAWAALVMQAPPPLLTAFERVQLLIGLRPSPTRMLPSMRRLMNGKLTSKLSQHVSQ